MGAISASAAFMGKGNAVIKNINIGNMSRRFFISKILYSCCKCTKNLSICQMFLRKSVSLYVKNSIFICQTTIGEHCLGLLQQDLLIFVA